MSKTFPKRPATRFRAQRLVLLLVLATLALPSAYAQVIVVAPMAAAVAIPVDRPLGLLLAALGICALTAWCIRKGFIAPSVLRSWFAAALLAGGGSLVFWGDEVLAQLQELQRSFTQAGGETVAIPVQTTSLGAGGEPLGFLPVVFSNQSSGTLRASSITTPAWNTCFPLGIPSPLPVTPARPGTPCSVGTSLNPGAACWVDVAQLCASAAIATQGSQPSQLGADVANVVEGILANGNVLTNDTDADGALLVASYRVNGSLMPTAAGLTTSVAGWGSFAIQADGSYTFTAATPFTGINPVVITYTTQTGASSTLTATVQAANRPPVAVADVATVNAGGSVMVAVRSNDTDPDSDPLTVTAVTQGANGAVVIDGATGNPVYTPSVGYSGSDSFTYTVTDGKGGIASATVSVTVTPAANQAPVTVADQISVAEGGVATTLVGGAASVLANDTDADANPLVAVLISGPAHGSLTLNANGTFSYTHNGSETTSDSFSYRANDGTVSGNTATVGITISPVNDAPVAVADSRTTAVNATLSIPIASLLANDTDAEGNSLAMLSVQSAVNGTVSIVGSDVVFTPTAGFEGAASFTYTITDGSSASNPGTVTVNVGSATAPSLVVQKALLAIAQGTGGTSVGFPITTRLVDTDGSESLTIRVSGVPTGLSFNAGINLGGGVWQFAEADLPNLTLNLPGSYTTLSTTLTVQVTSTETSTGATASVSSTSSLRVSYTTVSLTTTENGNVTATSANDFIVGGSGNNIINTGSGNNLVYGGAGDDTLVGGGGTDILYGGDGDDSLDAGAGSDMLIGGPGNDALTGGAAGDTVVDVFVWSLGDQGAPGTPAIDTIQNFSTAAAGSVFSGGDILHLRDLLQGEAVGPSNGAGNLADYLHFEISGGDTIVHVSHTGGFSSDSHVVSGAYTAGSETQQIVLTGVDLQALYSGATTDQQIITQLLNNNKLIVD
ncbi:Ig-like domain-containing protein [Acidovorax sp. RAC01]|uniref:Ig-like domain-containing protein n=1 Tax=Acidovorax sp. RAC01 TaxID=1842533 RepID=UPI0008573CA6|nr:Ig-like domain-containing protein [Acidovorax sp. RAC01]AOG24436.1 hypothetical protein BSY15_7 [Acidovorax sp. RAC01]